MLPHIQHFLMFNAVYTRLFFRDRFLCGATLAALALNVAAWILLVHNLPVIHQAGREFIALHYKVFYGIDYYSDWYYVFGFPLAGSVIGAANYFLSRRVFSHAALLASLLSSVSILFQLLLIFALYLVINLNLF